MQEESIKKYFNAANAIVLANMYLKSISDNNFSLKEFNPGHLGTSTSMNFILANLYYFLNSKKLSSRIIVGTGHAGVSLITNLWLNGTLSKYYDRYSQTKEGLNNLISDFGTIIRSEINPEYPETIYDGGELGYAMGVAYGYALNTDEDIIPCIIGDGEAETGPTISAWQLAKTINTKSKVLPIINLNGLKMGGPTYLSKQTDEELKMYFASLGYYPMIVNTETGNVIEKMQKSLNNALVHSNPLIIFKSPKGYTIDGFEGKVSVHKNPLINLEELTKLKIVRELLTKYDMNIFDDDDKLITLFDKFRPITINKNMSNNTVDSEKNISLDKYISKILEKKNGVVFSPDEIYSNKYNECSKYAIELLNENLLQAMYQGYTMAGNKGVYIAYEGFMPIISSMITQYYKYLKQNESCHHHNEINSLNYVLTSTCWENTYSHQNPDFVNVLLEKDDSYYNVVYPKDVPNAINCFQEFMETKNKINVLTIGKRHNRVYQDLTPNTTIETIIDNPNPNLTLCATGDYMLDIIMDVYDIIKEEYDVKIVYVTKPQILNINNHDCISEKEFNEYFKENVPCIYLYCGYASTIKAILYDRNIKVTVLGYNDGLTVHGTFQNNTLNNELSPTNIVQLLENKKIRRRKKDG